jgi:CHAD domain-containing protein
VAPLAMGLVVGVAATAALSVGLAVAIAERDRRAERAQRTRDRRLSLLPGEPPAQGLRRMVLGQLDLAIEFLAAENSSMPTAEAVHETRKALKRLRTLVKLLEDELGAQVSAREHAILRDAGRRLAGARDAEVMVSTLEALLKRHPRKLARRAGVSRLRGRLLAEREQATMRLLGDHAVRAQVLSDLRGARARMAAWTPAARDGIQPLEPALKRLYSRGRRRYLRASQGRGDRVAAMHRWRKSVKDLRYAAEALGHSDPAADSRTAAAAARVMARRRTSARAAPDLIPKLARRADRLGEMLGEEHDLVVLAERVRAEGHGCGRGTRRALLKLIGRRRKRLRRRALRDGARLYGRRPKKLLRRLRRAYALEARL